MASIDLLKYKHNIYTNEGEDGIIEKILSIIKTLTYECVEFGAWDGLNGCNTRNLIVNHGYKGVLIEGNKKRLTECKKNYEGSKAICLNQLVESDGKNTLDNILKKIKINNEFDVLSIDVDGNDYHIWKSLSNFRPKVVIIEYNPTIPNGLHFIQENKNNCNHGSSIESLVQLGHQKGYTLVCVQRYNLYFVEKAFTQLFNPPKDYSQLRKDLQDVTYIFSGYNGQIFIRGSNKLYGHNLKIKEQRLQVLPKFLFATPGYLSPWKLPFYVLYLLIYDRQKFLNALKRRIKK